MGWPAGGAGARLLTKPPSLPIGETCRWARPSPSPVVLCSPSPPPCDWINQWQSARYGHLGNTFDSIRFNLLPDEALCPLQFRSAIASVHAMHPMPSLRGTASLRTTTPAGSRISLQPFLAADVYSAQCRASRGDQQHLPSSLSACISPSPSYYDKVRFRDSSHS